MDCCVAADNLRVVKLTFTCFVLGRRNRNSYCLQVEASLLLVCCVGKEKDHSQIHASQSKILDISLTMAQLRLNTQKSGTTKRHGAMCHCQCLVEQADKSTLYGNKKCSRQTALPYYHTTHQTTIFQQHNWDLRPLCYCNRAALWS